ncbi:Trimethylguanosine synthase [Porphyridium purpureum]|uniref:Trimethylguanosine synthase n=1 Tax=Porphyridium purpureum TaxID=35688 RepID=A0A5J4YRC5_PORPP|nr:Trimethylguanosine synthase [Porphyridium purpureum]|eukprot:POR8230..scf236_6
MESAGAGAGAGGSGVQHQIPQAVSKYYHQRYRLFHRYDQGVLMDEELWFSVTPEKIAVHIAERLRGCMTVVDAFCGAGGNAIQFALAGAYVFTVDIDPIKVLCAHHNATVYGVADKIEFMVGDSFALVPRLRGLVDAIFCSSPWGGPSYTSTAVSSLADTGIGDVIRMCVRTAPRIAVLLPRNIDLAEMQRLLADEAYIAYQNGYTLYAELEMNYLGHQRVPKTLTLYIFLDRY